MFGHSLFRLSRQSDIPKSGEEIFRYPLPWENKISQMLHPRADKDNQIPTPCPAPTPPPPPPPLYHDYLASLLPLLGLPHNFNAISIFQGGAHDLSKFRVPMIHRFMTSYPVAELLLCFRAGGVRHDPQRCMGKTVTVPHFNRDTVEFTSRKRKESNPGIKTLLPFLKNITEESDFENFQDLIVTLDACHWLHKTISRSLSRFGDERAI